MINLLLGGWEQKRGSLVVEAKKYEPCSGSDSSTKPFRLTQFRKHFIPHGLGGPLLCFSCYLSEQVVGKFGVHDQSRRNHGVRWQLDYLRRQQPELRRRDSEYGVYTAFSYIRGTNAKTLIYPRDSQRLWRHLLVYFVLSMSVHQCTRYLSAPV